MSACVSEPKWSPDGQKVLFLASRKTTAAWQIAADDHTFPWIVDVKTREVRLVGRSVDRWYLQAEWMPDGRSTLARAAYGRNPKFYWSMEGTFVMSGGKPYVVVVYLDRRKEQVVWRGPQPIHWSVSPRGDRLLLYDRTGPIIRANHIL